MKPLLILLIFFLVPFTAFAQAGYFPTPELDDADKATCVRYLNVDHEQIRGEEWYFDRERENRKRARDWRERQKKKEKIGRELKKKLGRDTDVRATCEQMLAPPTLLGSDPAKKDQEGEIEEVPEEEPVFYKKKTNRWENREDLF